MERIWAPWRMEYIEGARLEGCVFCLDGNVAGDRERLVLHRSASSFIILNLYPYCNGHLMVIPYKHTSCLDDLDEPEMLDLMQSLRLGRRLLEKAFAPQGFNIGMNLGHAAGAGVTEHLHFHIVPRWHGDANYMTVTAETRVIPQSLTATYEKLAGTLAELESGCHGR